MTDLTPNDLSHLSDEEFLALCPQGEHAPGPEPLSPGAQAVLEPGDCDLHGRCWVWNAGSCRWWELVHEGMISYSHEDYTHWLPCNAFPIPEVTQ